MGGSSGLGFHISQALAAQGSHIVIVGRDKRQLETASDRLVQSGAASVRSLALDVEDNLAVASLSAAASSPHDAIWGGLSTPRDTLLSEGINTAPPTSNPLSNSLNIAPPDANLSAAKTPEGIDLLVNAIGKSDRGQLVQLTSQDLVALFRINVVTCLHAVQGCLDSLKRARGCIVNIGSLSSKVAPAGLGGYSIAKFGLAALSQQLRFELANDGIHTLIVCPGPIRRDDSGSRYQDIIEKRQLTRDAIKPAGGAKLNLIDPTWLASRILTAAQDRQYELIVPGKVRWLVALTSLWPALGDRILRVKMKASLDEE